MKYLFTLCFLALLTLAAYAQTEGVQPGKVVPNFSLTAEDGKTLALNDLAGSKAVVVVFTNPLCPNSRLYENRISRLAAAYKAQGVAFVLIHPGINMEAGAPAVRAVTGQAPPQAAAFPSYPDKDQAVSQQLGATKTPEAFVLQPVNGRFVLRYQGAIDDNPQLETAVRESYLQQAIQSVLQHRPVAVPEKRAIGCLIRKP